MGKLTNPVLPVMEYEDRFLTALRENAVVVLEGPTGSGKSTQIPQMILRAGMDCVVTQPRRLAARSVSARVAEEMGVELGTIVGWKVGGGQGKLSGSTRCLFCTDGLALVRELIGQNKGILVLDEVHEWNENMEVLVAWAKRQIEAGVDFKVVLMSATMEAEKLAAFFGGAPVISVPGRLYPVEDKPAGRRLEDDVADLLRQGRNVLVFQPGKAEITATIAALEQMRVNAEILPLHGQLTPAEQRACFRAYGRPKCVVSTNVAQTSVTIPDIDAVVDSGMERRIELVDGVEGLYLKPISRADAIQRKGRAGRVKPGIYIDHCGASVRPDFPVAEILRKRLDQTVLRLAIAGFDMEAMEFFHQPNVSDIRDARCTLIGLGCMRADGHVTRIGKLVNRLPVSVQYARMLVEADRLGVVDDVLNVAAIMEMGGITVPPPSRNRPDRPDWRCMVPQERESDIMGQLAVWKMAASMSKDEMRENGISIRDYFRAKEIRKHLARALQRYFRFGTSGKRENILKAVCAGMVDHLYKETYGRYQNGDGVERELGQNSVVRGAEWLVGKPFDLQIKTRRGMMTLRLIELASKVDPTWLTEVAPHLASQKAGLNPRYDAQQDVVVSTIQTFFNGQMVREEKVADGENPEAAKAFARWLSGQKALPYVPGHFVGQTLEATLRSNAERQEQARQLNIRTGEETFKVYSSEEMFERFVAALSGARRVLEVVRLQALALPSLDEDKVVSVLRDNPDTIHILGSDMRVEYKAPYYGTEYPPRVTLPEELLAGNRWMELPDEGVRLPGGRSVEVVVSFGYHTTIAEADIPQLKEKVCQHLNREQWDGWDRPEVPVPDPQDEGSVVPFITVVYGRCVVTGRELEAFGTVCWDSFYRRFDTRWYRDSLEARASREGSAEKLKERKAEIREERRAEQAKEAAEASREKLQAFRSHQDWYELDFELRRAVESRQYASLPYSADDLFKWAGETLALVAKVEAALAQIERAREDEAMAGRRLLDALQNHFSACPLCGQELEWIPEDTERAVENGCLDLPCGCYPESNLESAIQAIEAGVCGELIEFDNRDATVLYRLRIDGAPAILVVLYHKYGCWNIGCDVRVKAVADGPVEMVKVWKDPTRDEIHLANLRRQAETRQVDLEQARQDLADGYALLLSFRRGQHPKTGKEQWVAGSRKSGRRFVLDRYCRFPVREGERYFCRETRTLVDTPRFKLIAVEPYLCADLDPEAEIARLEAKIARKGSKAESKADSAACSVPAETVSESKPDSSGKLDLSGLLGKWG